MLKALQPHRNINFTIIILPDPWVPMIPITIKSLHSVRKLDAGSTKKCWKFLSSSEATLPETGVDLVIKKEWIFKQLH